MNYTYSNTEKIFNENEYVLSNGEIFPYLSFEALDKYEDISNLFSTRMGGVSKNEFSTLNLSFTRGDDEEAVLTNYKRVCEALNSNVDCIVTSDQTHTTNIRVVTRADAGKGITVPRDYQDIDGLITNERGLILSTFYADCVPLYFYDPVNKAIGLSHSGWRGTVQMMGKKTIEAMNQNYGTIASDVIACIGPSICRECYEISDDVAGEFKDAFGTVSESFLTQNRPEHFMLDLWKANEEVFLLAGIKKENIHTTNICTCCNYKLLFSHRSTKGKRGNLGAFIGLL